MGRSVVAAVVGKLLWAMRRPTVVFMAAVGVVVVLVGVMAVACTPPADTGSGTTPSGDTDSGNTGSGNTGSGNTGAAAAQAPFKEYLALVIARSLQFAPNSEVAHWGWDRTSLGEAKLAAFRHCVEAGRNHPKYYEDDCVGVAWVRNGILALAMEDLQQARQAYTAVGGWGAEEDYIKKAKNLAVQHCSAQDPSYRECKIVAWQDTDYLRYANRPLAPYDSGPWHHPPHR
jgi:hypothetical protein